MGLKDNLKEYEWDYEVMIKRLAKHFAYYDEVLNEEERLRLIEKVVKDKVVLLRYEDSYPNFCKMCGLCCKKQHCGNLNEDNKCIKWNDPDRSFLCSEYPYNESENGDGFEIFIDSECYFSRKLYIEQCLFLFKLYIALKTKIRNQAFQETLQGHMNEMSEAFMEIQENLIKAITPIREINLGVIIKDDEDDEDRDDDASKEV